MSSKDVIEFWHQPYPGELWCSRDWGEEPTKYAFGSAADIREILSERRPTTVYLYGRRDNAILVATLLETNARVGTPGTLRLASPRTLNADQYAASPRYVVSAARGQAGLVSTGGWRRATRHDYTHCQLIANWDRRQKVTKLVTSYLEAHPAWPALSFLGEDLNVAAAIELLCELYDPRWWLEPDNPDEPQALWERFELRSTRRFGRRFARGELTAGQSVLGPWFSPDSPWLSGPGKLPPHAWLYRRVRERQATAGCDRGVGVAIACREFLEFVQAVWLDRLYPGRTYFPACSMLGRKQPTAVTYQRLQPGLYSPQLFVPRLFFRYDDEVECWQRHCQQNVRGRVV